MFQLAIFCYADKIWSVLYFKQVKCRLFIEVRSKLHHSSILLLNLDH